MKQQMLLLEMYRKQVQLKKLQELLGEQLHEHETLLERPVLDGDGVEQLQDGLMQTWTCVVEGEEVEGERQQGIPAEAPS